MSVTYTTAVKNARMTAVRDQIDADASPGKLVLGTAGMAAELVSIDFDAVCGVVSAAALTMSSFAKSADSSGAGTLAEAKITDGAGTTIISGLTVGTSGADITVDNTSVTNGQTVTINSAVLTHA